MTVQRGVLLVAALLAGAVGRVWWLAAIAIAWVAIAQGDTKRQQNYDVCDAQAAAAFATGNLEDESHSSRDTRAALFALQDDVRRTCMQGKGYLVSADCGTSLIDAPAKSITLEYCYRRNLLPAVAAQLN